MATSSSTGDWINRLQKRRDAELSLLRRASETESQSTSSDHQTTTNDTSPASPKSSHSTANSSIRSVDQIQALQHQLQINNAQIEANEARIRELKEFDIRMSEHISERLSHVRDINESLRSLHDMLARTERVAHEFGVERKKSRA